MISQTYHSLCLFRSSVYLFCLLDALIVAQLLSVQCQARGMILCKGVIIKRWHSEGCVTLARLKNVLFPVVTTAVGFGKDVAGLSVAV